MPPSPPWQLAPLSARIWYSVSGLNFNQQRLHSNVLPSLTLTRFDNADCSISERSRHAIHLMGNDMMDSRSQMLVLVAWYGTVLYVLLVMFFSALVSILFQLLCLIS